MIRYLLIAWILAQLSAPWWVWVGFAFGALWCFSALVGECIKRGSP